MKKGGNDRKEAVFYSMSLTAQTDKWIHVHM